MPTDLPAFIKTISDAGVLGLLLLWVIGGVRGDWIWGREHRRLLAQLAEEKADRVKWQDLAWEEAHTMDRLANVVKRRA